MKLKLLLITFINICILANTELLIESSKNLELLKSEHTNRLSDMNYLNSKIIKNDLKHLLKNFPLKGILKAQVMKEVRTLEGSRVNLRDLEVKTLVLLDKISDQLYANNVSNTIKDKFLKKRIEVSNRFAKFNSEILTLSKSFEKKMIDQKSKALSMEKINKSSSNSIKSINEVTSKYKKIVTAKEKQYEEKITELRNRIENGSGLLGRNFELLSLVGIICLLGFYTASLKRVKELRLEKEKLVNMDHTSELDAKSEEIQCEGFNKLKDIGVVIIDEYGNVENVNTTFKNEFVNDDILGLAWDDFLLRNFKRESSLKGTGNLYRSSFDMYNDYLISSSLDVETGRRICTLNKIEAKTLLNIGKSRVSTLEANKFNAFDFLDLQLAMKNSSLGKPLFNLQDIQYADDAYLYTTQNNAEKVLNNLVSGLNLIYKIRGVTDQVDVKISRSKNIFKFSAFIKDINLTNNDFSKLVNWNGEMKCVADVLREIEEISSDLFGAVTVVKNLSTKESRGVSFVVEINDYAKLKWITQEFSA